MRRMRRLLLLSAFLASLCCFGCASWQSRPQDDQAATSSEGGKQLIRNGVGELARASAANWRF
jgi:hypothetical protein